MGLTGRGGVKSTRTLVDFERYSPFAFRSIIGTRGGCIHLQYYRNGGVSLLQYYRNEGYVYYRNGGYVYYRNEDVCLFSHASSTKHQRV